MMAHAGRKRATAGQIVLAVQPMDNPGRVVAVDAVVPVAAAGEVVASSDLVPVTADAATLRPRPRPPTNRRRPLTLLHKRSRPQ